MSNVIFKEVESLAEQLMDAAEANNDTQFYALYDQLELLCEKHRGSKKDHPVLWETLADFTEENEKSIETYEYAYGVAKALKDNEYKASILFSMAQRLAEEGEKDRVKEVIDKAAKFASFTEDQELIDEINQLADQL